MDDDWDLHAVVRGCAATATTTTVSTTAGATNSPLPSNLSYHDEQNSFDFSGLGDDKNDPFQDFREIYQEFCIDDPPLTAAASDISATGIMYAPPALVLQPHQHIIQVKPPLRFNQENLQFQINASLGSPPPQPIRPRRRKNQQTKIVRQMTQEELSADSWAWRKYGQKPIKGSPYPRNYYRCSTSKGCAARKQVERSPNDPEIFVVSYSGEHTHPRPAHRSSLAGSTRSKLASPPATNNGILSQKGSISMASSSSPSAASTFSPEGEAAAQNEDVQMAEEDGGDEDEENLILIPDDVMNDDDDMFRGFQDSDDHSSAGGDFFSSGLLSSPPWTPTSSAGGGGG